MSLADRADSASNLPSPLSVFVGRQNEMRALLELLDRARIVTITGSGGIGKTRLALEIARKQTTSYQDGVFLAELAPLVDPGLVPEAVAVALNLPRNPAFRLETALRAYLRERQALLVLDNCEHLIQGCAELSAALLSSCPSLRVLATSREPLGVPGEAVWRLAPLALPPSNSPLDTLTGYEAIALWLQRAGAAAPGFTLHQANAEAVTAICRRLDGIPLAIELAAARLRFLTAPEILAGLEQDSTRLSAGVRTAPERHRTLHATFAWSYALLDPNEKALFRLLASFAGGNLDAIRAVAAARQDLGDVQTLLHGLVEKSLVTTSADERQITRYGLLETLRDFAGALLREHGELEFAQRHHAEYFAAMAEQAEPGLYGPDQVTWVRRLEDDLDNLRSAIEWALRHDAARAVAMTGALTDFWSRTGRSREGRAWVKRALALDTDESLQRARALIGAARLTWELGDRQEAARMAGPAVAMARGLGDAHYLATALFVVGASASSLGLGDQAEQAWLEMLEFSDRPGDEGLIAIALWGLGLAAWDRGERQRAFAFLDRAIATVRPARDWNVLAGVLDAAAGCRILDGDPDTARSHWLEALAITDPFRERVLMVVCLSGLAMVDAALGRPRRSLRLAACADRIRTETGLRADFFSTVEVIQSFERMLDAVRNMLGPAGAATEWAAGRAMEPWEAAALAKAPWDEPAPEPAADEARPTILEPLSRRESEVALLVSQGMTGRQIAARLHLSERTIENHVQNALNKLSLNSRAQLAAWTSRRTNDASWTKLE